MKTRRIGPFEVSAIKKVTDEDHMHGFVDFKGPDQPFIKTLGEMNTRRGGSTTPVRSGPAKIIEGRFFHVPWKALYKAHFKLTIGNGRQVPLDPDVYCEWH